MTLGLVTVFGFAVVGLTTFNTHKSVSLSSSVDTIRLKQEILTTKHEIMESTLQGIESTLSDAIARFNNFTDDYESFRRESPSVIISTADLSSRLTSSHDRLSTFSRNWLEGKVHPVFSSLFNFTIPCSGTCPYSLMKPIDCETDTQQGAVKFAFEVIETNQHSHILKANAFQYYTINSSHACTFDYVGPNYILFNDQDHSSCPLQLRSINGPDIILSSTRTRCTGNKPDNIWSKNSCFKRDHFATLDLVQIKHVGFSNYILCPGFNVSFFNQKF